MKIVITKSAPFCIISPALVVLMAGCSSAPEAPTPQQRQQSVETQIQSIQNNPNMPPEAKQRAIQGIKSQQQRTTTQP